MVFKGVRVVFTGVRVVFMWVRLFLLRVRVAGVVLTEGMILYTGFRAVSVGVMVVISP